MKGLNIAGGRAEGMVLSCQHSGGAVLYIGTKPTVCLSLHHPFVCVPFATLTPPNFKLPYAILKPTCLTPPTATPQPVNSSPWAA